MRQRIHPQKQHPAGFTLIEITFSIAFLSMMMVSVLAGFLGVLSLYNQAQGLGRTADNARSSMSVLVSDLRQTTKVEYWPNGTDVTAKDTFMYPDTTTLVNANPRVFPAASQSLRNSIKDFYCLSSDTRQIGYALLYNNNTRKFHLARFAGAAGADGCSSFTKVEYLVDADLWSDGGGSNTVTPDSTALARSPKDYRPFQISKLTRDVSAPAVWQVKVGVHRGTYIPGTTSNLITDQFSASTTFQTIVDARR